MNSGTQWVTSSEGIEVALHDLGGSGPPLLICHATGFHGLAYEPFSRRLQNDFSIWALDMRGHGATAAPTSGDFAWSGMAEDVLACIEVIGAPVAGFGHSMGGAAIGLAEVKRPGSFRAAFLFEPIVLPDGVTIPNKDNTMGAAARKRRGEFGSTAEVLERYGSRPPMGDLDPDALAAYVEHGFVDTPSGTVALRCAPESEARTFEAPDKPHVSDFAGMNIPLLIGAGQLAGPMSPAHFAVATAENVDSAELRQHEDLGHFGPLENPDRIAEDLLEWMPAI